MYDDMGRLLSCWVGNDGEVFTYDSVGGGVTHTCYSSPSTISWQMKSEYPDGKSQVIKYLTYGAAATSSNYVWKEHVTSNAQGLIDTVCSYRSPTVYMDNKYLYDNNWNVKSQTTTFSSNTDKIVKNLTYNPGNLPKTNIASCYRASAIYSTVSQSYTYNLDGSLSSKTADTKKLEYLYDGMGRRKRRRCIPIPC